MSKHWACSMVLAAVLMGGGVASANDVYVAQTAAGTASGADCADALGVTYFNTSGNWQTSAGSGTKIGPGTTVHLCGTFSSQLTARGSGTSGSPITILFESGANISLPACDNSNGCLNIGGLSYVVVSGGAGGIIQNTANGTGLAHQQQSIGIFMDGCSNCEVKNITIQNIYVHSSSSDTTNLDNPDGCIYMAGTLSNVSIHDSTLHDCHWAINYQFTTNGAGLAIYDNNIYNTDHGIAIGGYGSGTVTATTIYGNHIHDYANWDTSSNAYHHDGIHAYTNAGAIVNGIDIHDNLFDGDVGGNFTSHIYLERDGSEVENALVYNNVALPSPNNRSNFGVFAFGSSTGHQVYNNTVGCGSTSGNVYGMLFEASSAVVKNNVIYNCFSGIAYYSASPSMTLDYNLYSGNTDVGYYTYSAAGFATLASWQSATSQESHSKAGSANLDSTGHPQARSAVIGAATNLTGLGITALNSDKAGVGRPASGAWDAGAYQHVAPPPPNPPTNVTATPH